MFVKVGSIGGDSVTVLCNVDSRLSVVPTARVLRTAETRITLTILKFKIKNRD